MDCVEDVFFSNLEGCVYCMFEDMDEVVKIVWVGVSCIFVVVEFIECDVEFVCYICVNDYSSVCVYWLIFIFEGGFGGISFEVKFIEFVFMGQFDFFDCLDCKGDLLLCFIEEQCVQIIWRYS